MTQESVLGPGQTSVQEQVRELVDRLAVPCVRIAAGPPTTDPTASFALGHPYLPLGAEWPRIGGAPAVFVAQVNFADVPPLDGFPASGLLQWFTRDDDTFGLTFDENQGAEGFLVRWYVDVSHRSEHAPDAATPPRGESWSDRPLGCPDATRLVFTRGRSLPTWWELDESVRALPLIATLGAEVGESDLELVWEEYVRGPSGPVQGLGTGSKIGGHPSFTQQDPRGRDSFAPASSPDGRLVIELDSAEFDGWGDSGIGHLFGDPTLLGTGDTSTVRYHWDCC